MMNKMKCVEMKHQAAAKIQEQLAAFSIEEVLAFWEKRTDLLLKKKLMLIERQKNQSQNHLSE